MKNTQKLTPVLGCELGSHPGDENSNRLEPRVSVALFCRVSCPTLNCNIDYGRYRWDREKIKLTSAKENGRTGQLLPNASLTGLSVDNKLVHRKECVLQSSRPTPDQQLAAQPTPCNQRKLSSSWKTTIHRVRRSNKCGPKCWKT